MSPAGGAPRQAYLRLVGTARQLVQAGVQQEPKWLRALERHPPLPIVEVKNPKPKAISFEEDRFIQSFYDRFPHAREYPVDLTSDEPPPARRYALRQLQLVQQGLPPRRARDIVDDEFREQGLLEPPTAANISGGVQQLEDVALQTAMAEKVNQY